jgi:hypothetical protein
LPPPSGSLIVVVAVPVESTQATRLVARRKNSRRIMVRNAWKKEKGA